MKILVSVAVTLGSNPCRCNCLETALGFSVKFVSSETAIVSQCDFGNSCIGFCAVRTGTESCQLFTLHVAAVFGATNTHNN